MISYIYPDNPQERNIRMAVDILRKGGVIIYPTDTVYALGCDIYNADAITRICRIKNLDPKKAQFTFVCNDLSHLSQYSKAMDTPVFRMLKRALPGPYTFILEASKQVPKNLKTKKDTVGIRVPDNLITQLLVKELGHPIMSVSLPMEGLDQEYYTDPEWIHEKYQKLVDLVIDSGVGGVSVSTIIDCTSGIPELIREGAGEWESLLA
ncbi:L-threonylcarbamoyladenylate synthase [Rurimicrobium arvi]|uniref:L-threonylcarbamoyladenylate synthase n=1 Tax=Rurimicrobium arvi TaxID=2049916 RepID=A0ABP8MFL5_9BACT